MRGTLANLALAALSTLVVLALAEAFVRIFLGPVQPRNLTRVPLEIRAPAPFEGVPYLMRPNAAVTHDFGSNPRGYFDGEGLITYQTSSSGWRSPEFGQEKPAGVFRILGLGDSFTFGTGVRREHLFLSALADALEAEAPGRTQVINLGVMGFATPHEVALLRNVGLALDPDLVVITYVLNDASLNVGLTRAERPGEKAESGRHGPGAFGLAAARRASWLERSLLVSHVRHRLRNREAREAAIARALADHEEGYPGWVGVQRALAQAARLSRDHHFALVLMIFPKMWELSDDYPFAPAHARVAAEAQRHGIPVLDLIDAFRGEDGPSLWVHPSNQHPNERGHAIAAAALHRFLRERSLLGAL